MPSSSWAASVACLTAAGTAVVAWIWLRSPHANRAEILKALRDLREECKAVYAEAAATVHETEGPASQGNSDEGSDLSQVLDQPLLLQHSLRSVTERAAKGLGGNWLADDFETAVQSYADEQFVREDLAELQREHQKALRGDLLPAVLDRDQGALFWESERLLPVLKELCAHRLRALEGLLGEAKARACLGPRLLERLEQAEEDFWAEAEASESSESRLRGRSCFGPAFLFLALAAEHGGLDGFGFRQSCEELERELDAQLDARLHVLQSNTAACGTRTP
ncbi:unnamed protein product [Symbiodinium sp. CCMP2592]|nr:unnamed protein product [Symbiodinium sp. CCMP2592]